MTEESKRKFVKKLCIPIKIATVILIIGIISIIPIIEATEEMYIYYELEEQIPNLVKSLINMVNVFQENILFGIISSVIVIGIIVAINFLWKYVAKKIVNSTKLDEETLKKRVNLFAVICSIIISLILIISFAIVFSIALKALMEIYMSSFIFDAYSM